MYEARVRIPGGIASLTSLFTDQVERLSCYLCGSALIHVHENDVPCLSTQPTIKCALALVKSFCRCQLIQCSGRPGLFGDSALAGSKRSLQHQGQMWNLD